VEFRFVVSARNCVGLLVLLGAGLGERWVAFVQWRLYTMNGN